MADEQVNGEPMLEKVMENGKLSCKLPTLKEIRAKASENISRLPKKYKKLNDSSIYPVELSQALTDLIEKLKDKITKTEILDSRA